MNAPAAVANATATTGGTAATASDGRAEARRFVAQRLSAAVLALCVVVHLATMVIAVRQGLNAGEILSRTRGSFLWGGFYSLFVLAVSIHAPLGLRNIAIEWANWRGRSLDVACIAFGLILLSLGWRAVWAVCWSAA